MRVLWLTTGYPHKGDPMSGIFHKTQAEALARNGADVEVVAPVPWVPAGWGRLRKQWREYRDTPKHYEIAGVRVYRPRYLQWPKGDYWASPHRAFQRIAANCLATKPDVIHAHFAYPPGLAATALAKATGASCVVTLHGDDVNTFPYANRLCYRRFAATCRRADAVLAVSEPLAERTRQLIGLQPQVLPIGVASSLFAALPDKAAARKTLKLPPDLPIVAYVGALLARKGIRELLTAMESLAKENVLAVLVGDGPLRGDADRCQAVKTAGMCDNATVLLYMRAADVLILPTYAEGMPTVLVEAGWVKLPIVASAVGGIPDLLAEGRGLLIEPKSSDQIVRGIRDVLANPEPARRRADRLLRYVQEDYDADRNARALIEIYRRAIS